MVELSGGNSMIIRYGKRRDDVDLRFVMFLLFSIPIISKLFTSSLDCHLFNSTLNSTDNINATVLL